MKRLSIVLALLGVLGALVLVSFFGFGNVIAAVSRIGWPEFAMIVGWQLVLFVILGLAWDVILPASVMRRPWVLIWGRMVRDASIQLPAILAGRRLRLRRPRDYAARDRMAHRHRLDRR